MGKVFGATQRLVARKQRWAAYRKQFVSHQPVGTQAGPMAAAVPDRGIDIIAAEIDQAGRCGDANVDAGMGVLKPGYSRQQPLRRQRCQCRDGENAVVVLAL